MPTAEGFHSHVDMDSALSFVFSSWEKDSSEVKGTQLQQHAGCP